MHHQVRVYFIAKLSKVNCCKIPWSFASVNTKDLYDQITNQKRFVLDYPPVFFTLVKRLQKLNTCSHSVWFLWEEKDDAGVENFCQILMFTVLRVWQNVRWEQHLQHPRYVWHFTPLPILPPTNFRCIWEAGEAAPIWNQGKRPYRLVI